MRRWPNPDPEILPSHPHRTDEHDHFWNGARATGILIVAAGDNGAGWAEHVFPLTRSRLVRDRPQHSRIADVCEREFEPARKTIGTANVREERAIMFSARRSK
jgi:hypothetical protein